MDTEKTTVFTRKRKLTKRGHEKRRHNRTTSKVSDKKDVRDSMKKIEANMKAVSNVDVSNRPAPITKKRLTMKVGLYNFGKMSDTITRVVSDETKARAEEDLKKILHLARATSSRVIPANEDHLTSCSDSSSHTYTSRCAGSHSPANKKSKPAKSVDSVDMAYSRFSTPSLKTLSSEGERFVDSVKSDMPKTPPFFEVSDRVALAFGRKVNRVFAGRSVIQEKRTELDILLRDRGQNIRLFKGRPQEEKSPVELEGSGDAIPLKPVNYQDHNPMDAIEFLKLAEERGFVTHKPPVVPRIEQPPSATVTSNYSTVRPPLRPQGVPCEFPQRKPSMLKGTHSLRPVTAPSIPFTRYPSTDHANFVLPNLYDNTGMINVTEDFATMQSHTLHTLTKQRRLVFDHGDFYYLQPSSQSSSPSPPKNLTECSAGDQGYEFRKEKNCASNHEHHGRPAAQDFQDGGEWNKARPERRCSASFEKKDEPVYAGSFRESCGRYSKSSVDLLDYLDTEVDGPRNRKPFFTYATPDSDGDPVWKPCSSPEVFQHSPTPSPKFYRHKLY